MQAPHAFPHAVCFKDNVYMHHDLDHGMLLIADTNASRKQAPFSSRSFPAPYSD
jgi:hypothetical protein